MPATARRGADDVVPMTPRRDLALRFEECRAMGHSWRHRPPIGIDDASTYRRPFGLETGMVGFPSACPTCGTIRLRWITRSGEVVVRYEHPDGYSRHGDERLSSGEWRRAYVGHIFDGFLSNHDRR
jgi:hypothetical protein